MAKKRSLNEYRQNKDFGYNKPVSQAPLGTNNMLNPSKVKTKRYTDKEIQILAVDYAISESNSVEINDDLIKGFTFGFLKALESLE